MNTSINSKDGAARRRGTSGRKRWIVGAGVAVSLLAAPVLLAAPSTAAVSAEAFTLGSPAALKTTDVSKTTIGVSWQAVGNAPNYRIQYSKNADMSGAVYVRNATTSVDIRNLESNTTYYFKVRVISADGNTSLSDYSGAVSAKTLVAPVLAPISNPLKVASYNVKCDNCFDADATADQLHWSGRRDTIVAQVKSRMPDVIGFQETSQGWLKDAAGKQINLAQFEDLLQRLNAAGMNYKVTNPNRNNCVKSTTPTDCVWADQGASQDAKIFYNANTVTMIDQGSKQLEFINPVDNKRFVSWASFQQKSSGKSFFFTDTHIEPRYDLPAYYDLKIRQSKQIVDVIKAKNTANLPVFVVGDMNSSKYVNPSNGPWDVFTAAGYLDPLGNDHGSDHPSGAAFAEKRINAEYNSFNGFARKLSKNAAPGANGKHLDYIFTSPMRVAVWEQVLNKDANDNITGVIPSDHNMIMQTVELPASMSPLSVREAQLKGSLGKATGSEIYTAGGGYRSYEKGYLIWSPATGAHTMKVGAIRNEFAARGYENGALGYPKSEQLSGGIATSYQLFQNGAIDVHPFYGAHATYGPIRSAWLGLGATTSTLGYPNGDVAKDSSGGSYQRFANGFMVGSNTAAYHASLNGPIRNAWASQRYEAGKLGYPTSEITKSGKVSTQKYQRGSISFTDGAAKAVITYK